MTNNLTDEIFTSKHIAERHGLKTGIEWVVLRCSKMNREKKLDTPYKPGLKGTPVKAFLVQQRWTAFCECRPGASEYVDPDEKEFYCFGCGNQDTGGHPRAVVFPAEATRLKIEQEIMRRPVKIVDGTTKLERARRALPAKINGKAYPRQWEPGISLAELRKDSDKIVKAEKEGKVKYGKL